jgi:hypothetical protein
VVKKVDESRKAVGTGLGGAIVTFIIAIGGLSLSPEAAAALATIVNTVLTWVVPQGG